MASVDDDSPKSATLQELLAELRRGFTLHKPILIVVEPGSRTLQTGTMEHTMTMPKGVDWHEQYRREYGEHNYVLLGRNTLATSHNPITIGRSRSCDVRIDNDSVSKVHASIVLDRATGGYCVVDEKSRNGTYINGESLNAGALTPIWAGAYVAFGDSVFVFIDPSTLRKLSKLAAS